MQIERLLGEKCLKFLERQSCVSEQDLMVIYNIQKKKKKKKKTSSNWKFKKSNNWTDVFQCKKIFTFLLKFVIVCVIFNI